MKKSVAIIIALCMLMSLLPIGMVSADEVVTPEPITVTASVASGATVFAGEKIKLTFSEAISEESLAGITVSGGVTPAFEAETGNTAVEITVPETAGALTITVAETVGNETNTIAEAKTFTYNVVNLLFDMEINGTDGAAVDQVNATVNATAATQKYLRTNTETGQKYAVSTTSGTPSSAIKPIYHQEGEIKYLTFKDALSDGTYLNGSAGDDARVAVPMDPAINIANKDNLTFEAWIRPNRAKAENWGYWFAVGKARYLDWPGAMTTEPNLKTDTAILGAWRQKSGNSYSGLGIAPDYVAATTGTVINHGLFKDMAEGNNNDGKLGDMSEFNNKWVHIVITKEWKGSNKWESILYVNGNKRTPDNTAIAQLSARTVYTDEFSNLFIGSDNRANQAFAGDISTFKLYDGVLDATTIRQKYYNSYETYYNTGDDGISKVLEVKVEDGAIVASSDADAPAPKRLTANAGKRTNGTTVTFQPTDPTVVPNENGVGYIKFASTDGTTINDTLPRLYYKLNDIEFADKDEMTVTTWARMPYMDDIRGVDKHSDLCYKTTLFALAGQPTFVRGDSRNIFRVTLIPNGGGTADSVLTGSVENAATLENSPRAVMGDIAAYGDNWAHYAITKTWVGNSGSKTNGKFVFKFYVNGAFVSSSEVAVANRADWSEKAATGTISDGADYIAIGGMGNDNPNASFFGDIAHFTLYSGELDAEQVAADYYTTCAPFVDSDVLGTLTMQGGAALTAGNIDQATEVNIDGLILKDMGENEPVVFLAVYGDEDSTKLIGVAVATVTDADGQLKFNAKVDGLTQGTAKHVKALVWDGFSNIRPLTDAVSCL